MLVFAKTAKWEGIFSGLINAPEWILFRIRSDAGSR